MNEQEQIGAGSGEILEKIARMTPQWLAGFFDGDGHVSVCRTVVNPARNMYLRLKCTFTGTDSGTLSLIASIYGLRGPYLKKSKKYKHNVYELGLTGKHCATLLRKILPYVVIRRKQVELALKFDEVMHIGSGCRLTEEQARQGIEIRWQISELNGAGRKLEATDTSQLIDKETLS